MSTMKPNEKIGPYRLVEPLGSGGMGTVWRAWDERLKRPVALKRVLITTDNPKVRERFRREAEAGARLNHSAIVHIYDIVETAESDWIVMELVEGRTLQALLREGPLETQQALRLGREIADGLVEAHAQGFIHRDLKAANVMVTSTGRAKILDFGVVKQIQPEALDTTLSAPGVAIGTSYAMSPEQAMGLSLDARSDLFSLGSLLYEMATGEAPFRAETASATLARVCSFRQRPASSVRPEVPHELSDLIDQLLEKDRVDRPASAVEVAEALARIATGPMSFSPVTQDFRGKVSRSEQETLPETPPVSRASVSLQKDVNPSQPAVFSGGVSATVPKGARSLRTAAGIAFLLLVAILAVYRLGSPVVQPSAHTLYQEGLEYLDRYDRKGNLDLAIDRFSKVLALDKTHAAAHAALAKAYWIEFQSDSRDKMWLDRALPMAERAVGLDPYLAAAQVSLGLSLSSAGRPEEALRHVERALALDPRNADAHFAAGKIYRSQGKLSEAEAAFKKAAEIHPHRMYLDELGSFYFHMGRREEAIAAFRRSLVLAPDGYIAYRNLGAAYFLKGDLSMAASQFQKALEIRPDAAVYANLGTIQFAQGFYEDSVETFEKALEMPGGANQYLVWGNLGDACRWAPDKKDRSREAYLRAIQLVEEQLRSTPDNSSLRSSLALYLAKRGDSAKALEELKALEKLSGKDVSSWFRIVVAYEVCGQREKALAALDRALRAGLSLDEIRGDPELLELRSDARYHRLIAGFTTES
jgi:eukaryotic-like serine/threonine-protein kinase